jgi:hypothetical protein
MILLPFSRNEAAILFFFAPKQRNKKTQSVRESLVFLLLLVKTLEGGRKYHFTRNICWKLQVYLRLAAMQRLLLMKTGNY